MPRSVDVQIMPAPPCGLEQILPSEATFLEPGQGFTVSELNPATHDSFGTDPGSKQLLSSSQLLRNRATLTIDTVGDYIKQIGQFELLTKDDEIRLAQDIEKGNVAAGKREDILAVCGLMRVFGAPQSSPERKIDRQIRAGEIAKEKFIVSNLRLVVSIAKKYPTESLDFADLIQHGNLGLIRAVEKFDWSKGFKFSTYASSWIRQFIGRGIDDESRNIRIPVHKCEDQRRMRKTENIWAAQNKGQTIPDHELCQQMGITPPELAELRQAKLIANTNSLDDLVGGHSDESPNQTLGDKIADKMATDGYENMLKGLVDNDRLAPLLDALRDRERTIVMAHSAGATFEEVGSLLGITRQAAQASFSRSVRKMKNIAEGIPKGRAKASGSKVKKR